MKYIKIGFGLGAIGFTWIFAYLYFADERGEPWKKIDILMIGVPWLFMVIGVLMMIYGRAKENPNASPWGSVLKFVIFLFIFGLWKILLD